MKQPIVWAAGVAVVAFVAWLIVGGPVLFLVVIIVAAIVVAGQVASPRDMWRAVRPGARRARPPRDDDDDDD